MFDKTQAGFADSYTTQVVLREEYQTVYGMYDHDNDNSRPLALVAMLAKENVNNFDQLEGVIRRYRLHDINDKFRLSIVDFLNLPRYYVDLLFAICAEEAARKNPGLEDMARELEKVNKQ